MLKMLKAYFNYPREVPHHTVGVEGETHTT
jgi:hypothetical protein